MRAKAEDGDPAAQERLGEIYLSGEGVERDKQEAVRWFQRAARQGNAVAMYTLAEITFRRLVDWEIREYIGKYPVLNIAGAFGSDAVLRFAERICGSYNFVTALPVSRLVLLLRAQGLEI